MRQQVLRRKTLATIGRGTAGTAATEFALVLPVLLIFIVGGANYGFMAYQEAALVAAARAGAEYTSAYVRYSILLCATATPGCLPTTTQMTAKAALPSGASFQSPSLAYACSDKMSAAIQTTTIYGSNCSSGTEMDYVQVTAQIASYASHSMLGTNLGIASFFIPSTLSATTYVRVQ